MDDNPYQAPRSASVARPSGKAIAGLSILSLLSLPAAAIAGSVTCNGLMMTGPTAFLLSIPAGLIPVLAIVSGALWFQQHSSPVAMGINWRRFFLHLVVFQLAAFPIAVFAGFVVGFIGYSITGGAGGTNYVIMLLAGITTYLICSIVVLAHLAVAGGVRPRGRSYDAAWRNNP